VAVPPGQSPLAYGLAIGMRIALFILMVGPKLFSNLGQSGVFSFGA
jgi:hypothetical protein